MFFVSNDQLLKVSKIVASIVISFAVILSIIYVVFAAVGVQESAHNSLAFVERKWAHTGIVVAVNAILTYDILSVLLWRLGIHRDDVQFRWKYHPLYGEGASRAEQEKWQKEMLMLPYTPTTDKYFIYPVIFATSVILLFLVDYNSNLPRM
jgi:hypothetical protein